MEDRVETWMGDDDEEMRRERRRAGQEQEQADEEEGATIFRSSPGKSDAQTDLQSGNPQRAVARETKRARFRRTGVQTASETTRIIPRRGERKRRGKQKKRRSCRAGAGEAGGGSSNWIKHISGPLG